jgi:hypothetical protein
VRSDASGPQRSVTGSVAVSTIGSARESQCRRLNAKDAIRRTQRFFGETPVYKTAAFVIGFEISEAGAGLAGRC